MGNKAAGMWSEMSGEQQESMGMEADAKEDAWDGEFNRRQWCIW